MINLRRLHLRPMLRPQLRHFSSDVPPGKSESEHSFKSMMEGVMELGYSEEEKEKMRKERRKTFEILVLGKHGGPPAYVMSNLKDDLVEKGANPEKKEGKCPSLHELMRPVKLREMEEKESKSSVPGISFEDLRETVEEENKSDDIMESKDFCEVDGDSQTPESASTSSPVDPLVEVLEKLVTSFDEHLGNICRVIGYEAELGKMRKDLFSMLDRIPNLTLDQKINVSKVLAKDGGALEMFIGFSDEARARYVGRLLNGESA